MGKIVERVEVDLTASAEDLWPLVSDTERTNRWTKAGPVAFEKATSDSGAARFLGRVSLGGFSLRYEEEPFEWEAPKRFCVRRRMIGGPLREYTFYVDLVERSGKGTTAKIRLEIEPRYTWLSPLLGLSARKVVRDTAVVFQRLDEFLSRGAPSPYGERDVTSAVNDVSLDRAIRDLQKSGVEPALLDRMARLVKNAPDADVARIRPYEVADAARLDRKEVLSAFLHAVPAGLFELRWAIVCPSCRTASDEAFSLDELKEHSTCHLCELTFDVELDQSIEATFMPHQSVRAVPRDFFCIGGPSRTPHVVAQAVVPPNQARDLVLPPEFRPLRFFARGGAAARIALDLDSPEAVRVEFGKGVALPSVVRVRPGGVISAYNRTAEPRHVKLELVDYGDRAATAEHVATVPEFRRLFSKQLLKPGTPLKVSRISVFFSDLTGSTALYTSEGDAAAFRFVDDHFDVLRREIESAGGVIVKTMGDAVMAAFSDPIVCAKAAVRAMEAFEVFRKQQPQAERTGLKVGMFAGPCYVVTQNGTLDYFGQTVNMASRLQHLAESGEIVLPQELAEELFRDLGDLKVRVSPVFEAQVKGVEGAVKLVRLIPHTTMSKAPPSPTGLTPER